MNIIDAIKSGKRIKINRTLTYQSPTFSFPVNIMPNILMDSSWLLSTVLSSLEIDTLISDEWAIEEEKVEITKRQAEGLYLLGIEEALGRRPKRSECKISSLLRIKLKELGFK